MIQFYEVDNTVQHVVYIANACDTLSSNIKS